MAINSWLIESGQPTGEAAGVTFLRAEGNRAEYHVRSGRYVFEAPNPAP